MSRQARSASASREATITTIRPAMRFMIQRRRKKRRRKERI
jgi:hypothetical protein